MASRATDWLRIVSLKPASGNDPASLRARLKPGDPVGLLGVPNRTRGEYPNNLDGCGATLIERRSDGWLVQPSRLAQEKPPPLVVPAKSVCALPNWSFLGVSPAFLRDFIAAQIGDDATTEDVCERIVKPITEGAGASLAACLLRLDAKDKLGQPFVRNKLTAFIWHARKDKFKE